MEKEQIVGNILFIALLGILFVPIDWALWRLSLSFGILLVAFLFMKAK